eukprot:414523_1
MCTWHSQFTCILLIVIALLFQFSLYLDTEIITSSIFKYISKSNQNASNFTLSTTKSYTFSKPWSTLKLNIELILKDWANNNISTSLPTNYTFLPSKFSKRSTIKTIKNHYKMCVNITSNPWSDPIGIPSNILSTNLFKPYNKEVNELCLIYAPGFYHRLLFSGQINIIEYEHYITIHSDYFGHQSDKCFKKEYVTIHYLCTDCDQYSNNFIINLAIPLFAPLVGKVASHFEIFIPNMWSIILDGIIGTNSIKNFKAYFWHIFGLSWNKVNIYNKYINITFIHVQDYSARKTKKCPQNDVYFSPFLIQSYFIRKPYINIPNNASIWSGAMPRNTLYNIKHFLTDLNVNRNVVLYLSRGDNNTRARGVDNNEEVIERLKQFVNEKQSVLNYTFEIFHHSIKETRSRYNEEQIFSKSVIIIGPHGGALANLNSVQPGSFVIEFNDLWIDQRENNRQEYRNIFFPMSQANGLNYYYLKPHNFDYVKGSMYIHIDSLLILLNEIYERINKNGLEKYVYKP